MLSRRVAPVAGLAALLLALLAAPASAHVTADPNEADSSHATTAFRIGHGCEGSPTISVEIHVPDGIEDPKPEVTPGWETEITEDGTAIAWTGDELPDNQFQEFGMSFVITEEAPEVLYFPTVQLCEEGEHRWITIPASLDEWGDAEDPAPYVINNLASGGGEEDQPAAAEEEPTETPGDEPDAAASDSSSDPLPVVAIVVAALGLVLGAAALTMTIANRRRT